MDKIALKNFFIIVKKTEKLPQVWLHYSLCMQKCQDALNLKSTTADGFNFVKGLNLGVIS